MKVFGGMLTRRLITAADVPAGETQPQMYPFTVRFETFFTAFGRARLNIMNLIQMRASCGHNCFPSMRNKTHILQCRYSASAERMIIGRRNETGAIKA